MKTVHFMMYDMGAGHRSTANALREVITTRGLPWRVEIVDVFKEIFGTTLPHYVYNNLVLKKKWARLINDPISVPLFKLQIQMRYATWNRLLRRYWRDHQPDLVVSLLPLVNRVLCDSLRAELPDTPFVTSITDFADCPPHFWIEPQAQWLICPSERAVKQAQALGYPQERLMQTSGVVIHPRFCEPETIDRDRADGGDRAIERQRLGLDPDRPTGLVVFGSYGAPEMLEIARQLEQSSLDLQFIFICGRNQPLADELRRMKSRFPKVVEGFTQQLPDYMWLSDFFIGKPGSVGISEAIAMHLPVITECNRLTLFQERPSADWLVEQELGMVVDQFREINSAVAQLLQPETFSRYQANVAAYRNRAVFEVVSCLETILDHSAVKTVQESLLA